MGYIRTNEDYERSIGRPQTSRDAERVKERNRRNGTQERVPGDYVGYRGSVEQQPDNPQNRYTDDD